MIIFMFWPSSYEAVNSSLHIVVGAVPTSAEAEFLAAWRPTFEAFLNEEVGKHFMQPVSFSLHVLNLSSVFDAVSEGKIDFIFANPSLYSCLDPEFSGPFLMISSDKERSLIWMFPVSAIATLRNNVGRGESSYFGGIFFTRSDNHGISVLDDMRGKIVEASSIMLMGSGQAQWDEMRHSYLDLLVDPAQVK